MCVQLPKTKTLVEISKNKASQTLTYLLCPHILNTKKIHFNLNSLNIFTRKTSSPNVKPVLIR